MPHCGRDAEKQPSRQRGTGPTVALRSIKHERHRPEDERESERVLPEVEGVDRGWRGESNDPERRHSIGLIVATETLGESPSAKRGEQSAENRDQPRCKCTANLVDREGDEQHRQGGGIDPLAIDMRCAEHWIQRAFRICRFRPVAQVRRERTRAIHGLERGDLAADIGGEKAHGVGDEHQAGQHDKQHGRRREGATMPTNRRVGDVGANKSWRCHEALSAASLTSAGP